MKISDLIEHLTCLSEAHGDLDLHWDGGAGLEGSPVNVFLKYDAYDDSDHAEISIEFEGGE